MVVEPRPISQRQMQILELMAEGLSNPDIAQRLYLSEDTVKTHTKRMFSAWQVTSRGDMVRAAQAAGLIGCPRCRNATAGGAQGAAARQFGVDLVVALRRHADAVEAAMVRLGLAEPEQLGVDGG
jgi:DNA-binding CsgD family transcriptional regulator